MPTIIRVEMKAPICMYPAPPLTKSAAVGEGNEAGYQGDGPYNGGKKDPKPSRFRADDFQNHRMIKQIEHQTDQQNNDQELRKDVFKCLPGFLKSLESFLSVFYKGKNEQNAGGTYLASWQAIKSFFIDRKIPILVIK